LYQKKKKKKGVVTTLLVCILCSLCKEVNTDIEWLKSSNSKVGCDNDSFVRNYLEDVIGFHSKNIITVFNESAYTGLFEKKNIIAAFLELPYKKVFINKHCKGYIAPHLATTYKFGGFGFVSRYYNFAVSIST
jgi:hypothetical protein